jgi:hypothetical protein
MFFACTGAGVIETANTATSRMGIRDRFIIPPCPISDIFGFVKMLDL